MRPNKILSILLLLALLLSICSCNTPIGNDDTTTTTLTQEAPTQDPSIDDGDQPNPPRQEIVDEVVYSAETYYAFLQSFVPYEAFSGLGEFSCIEFSNSEIETLESYRYRFLSEGKCISVIVNDMFDHFSENVFPSLENDGIDNLLYLDKRYDFKYNLDNTLFYYYMHSSGDGYTHLQLIQFKYGFSRYTIHIPYAYTPPEGSLMKRLLTKDTAIEAYEEIVARIEKTLGDRQAPSVQNMATNWKASPVQNMVANLDSDMTPTLLLQPPTYRYDKALYESFIQSFVRYETLSSFGSLLNLRFKWKHIDTLETYSYHLRSGNGEIIVTVDPELKMVSPDPAFPVAYENSEQGNLWKLHFQVDDRSFVITLPDDEMYRPPQDSLLAGLMNKDTAAEAYENFAAHIRGTADGE